MQIVLIGYMGSGKSVIGKLLAKKMELNFVDLDDYIEEAIDTKISDIFKEKGEVFFRKKEHKYLEEVLKKEDNLVLATGGGTPCYAGNIHAILNSTDHIFYLKVSIPELVRRLYEEKDHRPLIKHLEFGDFPGFIGKHLFERSPFYEMATNTIICDNKSQEEISEEIKDILV